MSAMRSPCCQAAAPPPPAKAPQRRGCAFVVDADFPRAELWYESYENGFGDTFGLTAAINVTLVTPGLYYVCALDADDITWLLKDGTIHAVACVHEPVR